MAKKRAKIDATLAATRSSGIFTQDTTDDDEDEKRKPGNGKTAKAQGQGSAPAMPQRRSEGAPAAASGQGAPPQQQQANGRAGAMRLITAPMEKRFWAICHGANVPETVIKEQLKGYGYEKASEIKSLHYDALCKWAEDFGKQPTNPNYGTEEREAQAALYK